MPAPAPATVAFIESDGYRSALHQFAAPAGGTSDSAVPAGAVLVLPALGVPARKYFRFADELAQRGLSTGVLDFRGHGDSAPAPSRADRYGYADLVADTHRAIARLREFTGAERVTLVGHSLGGQVALIHTALFEPLDVVLVGVGLPYWRDYGGRYRVGLLPMTQTVNAIAQVARVSPVWSFGGAQSRGVMADWAYTARHGSWPRMAGVDAVRRLGEARFRLLVVHVENDTYTPPGPTRRLASYAGAARIEEWELTEAMAGAPLDHFAWTRASGPLATRVAQFADETVP